MKRISLAVMLAVSAFVISCSSHGTVDIDALVVDAEFSGGSIVLPEIRIDSADAEKANAELKKLNESWLGWKSDGIDIASSYSTAYKDGKLSVWITEVFDDGNFVDSRYYSYLFDVQSGRSVEYGKFLELFGITPDEAEFYVKLAYAKLALDWSEEDFMPYQTLRGAMAQSLRNYADSTETGYITYYFNSSGTPYITVLFVTPDGSLEKSVELAPSSDVAPLLRGRWILDAGDRVHRLEFSRDGLMNITVTGSDGAVIESTDASFSARPVGTEVVLDCTADGKSFEMRLSGTFVHQFIVLHGDSIPIAPGEYTSEEPNPLYYDYGMH